MKLELLSYTVENVEFDSTTKFSGHCLLINRSEMLDLISSPAFAKVSISLAKPGDETRIVHILDTVEPRSKVKGEGSAFPGFARPPFTAGNGATARLSGVVVMAAAVLPDPDFEEGIVDMSGQAAAFTPFSKTFNVVLSFEPSGQVSPGEFDDAVRRALFKSAGYLAATVKGLNPDSVQVFSLAGRSESLPRVALILQLHCIRTNKSFIYGQPFSGSLPTFLHPNEILDGAVVSGHHHYSSMRNVTYLYQNSPIIKEMYRRDGHEFSFTGVILTRPSSYEPDQKICFSAYSANLTKMLAADGAIICQDGGGHGFVDMMMTCKACEELGIKTVLMVNEMSGADGRDTPLLDVTPEAGAMITTGNYAEMIELPRMKQVLGGKEYFRSNQPAEEACLMPLRNIYCSTSQMGSGNLTTMQY